MVLKQIEALMAELGLNDRRPPDLLRSPAEVGSAALNGYTHTLRRAWKSFNALVGVFCVGGRPTIYIENHNQEGRITGPEQRRFWSQGVAPILLRITPPEVQIYSGLQSPAVRGEGVDANKRLVEAFDRTTRALDVREFLRSVEAGAVYNRYAENFDPTQSVDQHLVQNLRAARELMSAGHSAPDLPAIHRLLGRILFTCYLEARQALLRRDFGRLGAGAKATFRDLLSLSDPDAVRRALRRLFGRLGRYFRGDLFDTDLAQDLDSLRDRDIDTLRNLITGHELGSGQIVLPFDVYDFSVIPIETISAVYEDFIRAEDSKAQKKQGAYYTPPKLVAFTADLATEGQPNLTDKRVLDPGCGSGVFLVSMFNRMAEAWVRQNGRARNGTRAKALARILRENICGVDISLIACQSTCFSLYMALLDFLDPPEIRRLGPERLPNLLLNGAEKLRQNGPRTVIHGDFLASLPALEGQTFDLIIGNPPWVARGNVEEDSLTRWESQHPAGEFPLPARQVACAFMWEVPRYLKGDGRACLLLPAKILLGDQTDTFQVKWFRAHRVEKVAQLSDMRFYLFPGADHPALALRFVNAPPKKDDRLEYLTPKTSRALLCDNMVALEPDDRKLLDLCEIIASAAKGEAARCWLSYNWASPRDREFLARLRELPPLGDIAGEPEENKRWIKAGGFQVFSEEEEIKNPKPRYWREKHSFLPSTSDFDLILKPGDVEPVDPMIEELRRLPDRGVFAAPLVVFNKGFSKIAFSPFDVLFRDGFQAVAGPKYDRDLLQFLTATFLSPLTRYFIFHLSSKAFYRTPFLTEITRIPFPLPNAAPGRDPEGAIRAVAQLFDQIHNDPRFGGFGHHQLLEDGKRELTKHVYTYFDVNPDEEILIEDVVSTLQGSVTPSRGSYVPTLATPTKADRERYARTLIEALQAWSGSKGGNLSARCVLSEKSGVAVLTITAGRAPGKYSEAKASSDLDQVLSHLVTLAPERYRSIAYLRNIAVMEENRMHVVKPLTMRFWLRSAALNDADAAASHLLNRKPARLTA